MWDSLIISLIFNVSLLVTVATILTEFSWLRQLFFTEYQGLKGKLVLGGIFGVLAALCTYGGIEIMGAIVNTRVISVTAAGIIGGPLSGVVAGVIGGVHRYFYYPDGFTALGCCLGTITFGVIGGVGHVCCPNRLRDRRFLVSVTVIGELMQAGWLLLLSHPVEDVILLEKIILVPKLIMNSLGMVLLFGVIDRLQQSRRQVELRRQAELKALQSQINPHFFCNALTAISALCRNDAAQARHLLLVLADYYRQTLSINEPLVPLEAELRNVDNYLTIAQARFEDDIHLTVSLPDDMEGCALPPLIIQPIVENAVRHGMTATHDRSIDMRIIRTEHQMTVAVTDRGQGFDQTVLDDLKQQDCPRYTGMFNVHKRLCSIYGVASGLQVESRPTGSTVHFTVPIRPIPSKGGDKP